MKNVDSSNKTIRQTSPNYTDLSAGWGKSIELNSNYKLTLKVNSNKTIP